MASANGPDRAAHTDPGLEAGVVRVMAQAPGQTGITVNGIAPGGTASRTLLAVQPDAGVGAMQRCRLQCRRALWAV